MNRDIRVYIQDILESIDRIEEYTSTLTEEAFGNSIQVQDAVLRRFEIIGEAAKHIPDDFREEYPNIPWKENDLGSGMHIDLTFQDTNEL